MSEIEAEVVIEEHEAGTEEQEALKNDALVALRLPKEIVALIDRVVEEGKLGSRSAVIRTWICGLFNIPDMKVGDLISFYAAFTKFLELPAEPFERMLFYQFMHNLTKAPEEMLGKYVQGSAALIAGFYVAQSEKMRERYPELKQGMTEDMGKAILESPEIQDVLERVEVRLIESIHSLSENIAGRLDAVGKIITSELDR